MFRRVLAATGCALLALVHVAGTAPKQTNAGFVVTIDGNAIQWVKSVAGGSIYADVVEEAPAPNGVTPKHVNSIYYEDITLAVSPIADSTIQQLVQGLLAGNPAAKDGSVITTNFDMTIA